MQTGHIKTSNQHSRLEANPRLNGFATATSAWVQSHPILSILIIALVTVLINCYPIIFFGKSFVSPMSTAGALVYDFSPRLPGLENLKPPATIHSGHGSDTEAIMWWGVPVGFIESRSVWEQGTLPLWNRYSHAGDTLIGQALSMIGDPLQLIVILGHGSAGAWDIKYLTSKWLFCVGFGLLIRRLLNNLPLALIFTALAAYCGAYFFINSHPMFFVLTYAPWILLAAVKWLDLAAGRQFRWLLVWLLANFACFNAGHVEAAVVLITGLNLAALMAALMTHRQFPGWTRIFWRMGVATLFFLGLTAPIWVSFLVTLDGSYTAHDKIEVKQLPVTMLPGAFDDLFYLLFRQYDSDSALAPGTSLLIFVGCCLSGTRWQQLKNDMFFRVNTAAIFLWTGCVFKLVPAGLLATIPLLNRVGHCDTDFSYLLVMHLTIQCAYGFKSLKNLHEPRRIFFDFGSVGLFFFALMLVYSAGNRHEPIPWSYLWVGVGAIAAPLLYVLMRLYHRPALLVGWPAIILFGFAPNYRFGLYNLGDDRFLMLPGPRLVLNAPSPAVDKIKKIDEGEPFRVAGLQANFMGDYPAVYGLEDIRSCAPVSSGNYINLVRHFPGMQLTQEWKIGIANPALAQPLLNLLNVKFLLTLPDVVLPAGPRFRMANRSDFGVVENLEVWPRAYFANQVVTISSNEDFIAYLLNHSGKPFVAVTKGELDKNPGLATLDSRIPGSVAPATHYSLLPNSTEFDVSAGSAGVVCLTEGQAKDFTATANDQPKAVLTVNRAFKGIYLDKPGNYHVKFTYRPRYWGLTLSIFWLSMTGVILMGIWGARKTEQVTPP